jgi:hypothetical protein
VVAAGVVCIEFVTMMAAIDRIAEAAAMLGHLETANDFGAMAGPDAGRRGRRAAAQLADAAAAVAAGVSGTGRRVS